MRANKDSRNCHEQSESEQHGSHSSVVLPNHHRDGEPKNRMVAREGCIQGRRNKLIDSMTEIWARTRKGFTDDLAETERDERGNTREKCRALVASTPGEPQYYE